jgi:hypothetical protein
MGGDSADFGDNGDSGEDTASFELLSNKQRVEG